MLINKINFLPAVKRLGVSNNIVKRMTDVCRSDIIEKVNFVSLFRSILKKQKNISPNFLQKRKQKPLVYKNAVSLSYAFAFCAIWL